MMQIKYEVDLEGIQMHVWAFNEEQAIMMAQREAIKFGLSGVLISIRECS